MLSHSSKWLIWWKPQMNMVQNAQINATRVVNVPVVNQVYIQKSTKNDMYYSRRYSIKRKKIHNFKGEKKVKQNEKIAVRLDAPQRRKNANQLRRVNKDVREKLENSIRWEK